MPITKFKKWTVDTPDSLSRALMPQGRKVRPGLAPDPNRGEMIRKIFVFSKITISLDNRGSPRLKRLTKTLWRAPEAWWWQCRILQCVWCLPTFQVHQIWQKLSQKIVPASWNSPRFLRIVFPTIQMGKLFKKSLNLILILVDLWLPAKSPKAIPKILRAAIFMKTISVNYPLTLENHWKNSAKIHWCLYSEKKRQLMNSCFRGSRKYSQSA